MEMQRLADNPAAKAGTQMRENASEAGEARETRSVDCRLRVQWPANREYRRAGTPDRPRRPRSAVRCASSAPSRSGRLSRSVSTTAADGAGRKAQRPHHDARYCREAAGAADGVDRR